MKEEKFNLETTWDKTFPKSEKAHSRYFSEDVYKKLKGDNKELLIIPGAVHTDLYDRKEIIPFDKIEKFFQDNLK